MPITLWVPKINDLIVYFGKAEVRVAFNDRAERYHSRNLVTERAVIGQYDFVTKRERYRSCNLVTERDSRTKPHRSASQ